MNDPIELAQFNSSGIVIYNYYPNRKPRTENQIENEKNLTRGQYNGYMSYKTKGYVTKMLSNWVDSVVFARNQKNIPILRKRPLLTFVTLTLSAQQSHSDNEIKRKCLIPFIELLIQKFGVKHYFWRAEPQKNGNIHFHILTDSFIKHQTLRECWNSYQNRLGYINRFELKHNHRNPNSTDIHSLRSIRNPSAYVCKYMSKQEAGRKIEGRIWGCSDALREIEPFTMPVNHYVSDYLNFLVKSDKYYLFSDENFTFIKVDNKKLMKSICPRLYVEYQNYLKSVAIFLYNDLNRSFTDISLSLGGKSTIYT